MSDTASAPWKTDISSANDNVRARLRQPLGNTEADTTIAASHNRDFSGQVKHFHCELLQFPGVTSGSITARTGDVA